MKPFAALIVFVLAVSTPKGMCASATDFPRAIPAKAAALAQLASRDSSALYSADTMEARWKREEILRNAKRSDQSSDKLTLIVVPLLLIIAVIGVLRLRDF